MELLISRNVNRFTQGWNAGGVYMAKGVCDSDSFTHPIYIGSAQDLRKRIIYQHIPELLSGRHCNPAMRNYFIKYGPDCFEWYLLEESNAENLISVEQRYLDIHKPFIRLRGGFNILEIAGSCRGNKASDITRQRMRASKIGKRYPQTDRMRLRNAAIATPFRFVSPSGQLVEGSNLRQFCIANSLTQSNMQRLRAGQYKSSKGWTLAA